MLVIKLENKFSISCMIVSIFFLFCDVSFSKVTYQINSEVSSFNLVFFKGLISFLIFVGYSRICKVNVFKLNQKYNEDLDEEESIDVHVFMLLMVAVVSGWCASILEIIAIKSMNFSSTSLLIISNNAVLIPFFPYLLKSAESVSKYDIISIGLLFVGSNVSLVWQHNFISSIQSKYMEYILWVISWILIAISQVFLKPLNKKMHYLFYCTYFSIGYLIVSLAAFTISSYYLDLSLHNLMDLSMNVLSAVCSAIFIFTISRAYQEGKPIDLAPSWNLLIILAVLKNIIYEENDINYLMVFGAVLAWSSLILHFISKKIIFKSK